MDLPVYDVTVVRDLTDLTLFDDLFTIPDYTGHSVDEVGYVLHFDGDLTTEQQKQVMDRVSHTVEQEEVVQDARSALRALRTQIPPGSTTVWTNAQISDRLRLLARIDEGLIRLALDDMTA